MADHARATEPSILEREPTGARVDGVRRGLPDPERAAATFMAADLPWLTPEAVRAFADVPEIQGRPDGHDLAPDVGGADGAGGRSDQVTLP